MSECQFRAMTLLEEHWYLMHIVKTLVVKTLVVKTLVVGRWRTCHDTVACVCDMCIHMYINAHHYLCERVHKSERAS